MLKLAGLEKRRYDFIAASRFCKGPEVFLLDVCVPHMFMRTGPGHYSVGALTARSDLSAKWEMTAANTLSLWQVMVMPFTTRDTPQ